MKKQILSFCLITCSYVLGYGQSATVVVHAVIDQWHQAAAKADFDTYFNLMHPKSVYLGTDATERWDKNAFMAYAKPHFDKGKAWSFSPVSRHVDFSDDGKTVWFDELLNTQMKICRGSGVLIFEDGKWLIRQYVLSMTVPNEDVAELIKLKAAAEDRLLERLHNNN
ncbi:nuclear transport factor 2 family protein [Sphingobacterium sp. Mn56C]|uniref:nuclear transport factor 2 family protein n=1 Tax=Sphingobacterium sp. Mn56C TaxID=3395261 RepID=UPI003BE08E4F